MFELTKPLLRKWNSNRWICAWVIFITRMIEHKSDWCFPNNLMLKSFPSLNVPLYRSLNLFPSVSHSIQKEHEPNWLIESMFTHVCISSNSEFIISANTEDGGVWIWNATFHCWKSELKIDALTILFNALDLILKNNTRMRKL